VTPQCIRVDLESLVLVSLGSDRHAVIGSLMMISLLSSAPPSHDNVVDHRYITLDSYQTVSSA
jgi:hypothetical protein